MSYGAEPVLFTIGDIGITEHWIVTPTGTAPLAGSRWSGIPNVGVRQETPWWAIVGAILFVWVCLLGLLLLLSKRDVVSGTYDVQVDTVSGAQYVTRLPVRSHAEAASYDALVMHVRQAAWAAGL